MASFFSLGHVSAPKNAQTILTSLNQSGSYSRNVDPITFVGGNRFVDRVSQTDRVVVILEEELERPLVLMIKRKKTPEKAQTGHISIKSLSGYLNHLRNLSDHNTLIAETNEETASPSYFQDPLRLN